MLYQWVQDQMWFFVEQVVDEKDLAYAFGGAQEEANNFANSFKEKYQHIYQTITSNG